MLFSDVHVPFSSSGGWISQKAKYCIASQLVKPTLRTNPMITRIPADFLFCLSLCGSPNKLEKRYIHCLHGKIEGCLVVHLYAFYSGPCPILIYPRVTGYLKNLNIY